MAKEDQECLYALFVTNPLDDMSRIQSTKDALLEGSCSWIFGDPTYTSWLNSRNSRPLWIHGDPGKGKTMLTIAVIAQLSKWFEHSDNSKSVLAYFFCDDKDDRTNNAVAILRGLLYQILCQQPTLFGHLKSEYNKQGAKLFESRNALQTLWRILQSTLLESRLEEFYLIVDALDECDLDSRTVFLRLVEKEIDGNTTKTTPRSAMKWMLTSRNELDIKEALLDGLDISLELNSNQVDVAVSRFIDVKVKQLLKKKRYSRSHQIMVQDTLKSKAEGTFLWVSLACAELEKSRAVEGFIWRALESLPRGLEGIYEQVLERVMTDDQIDGETASEILKAVLIAERPLTIYELASMANLPKEYWNDNLVLSEYVSQCRSLLTSRGISNDKTTKKHVTPRDVTIHLVHQSAKDFLISPKSKLLLSPGLVEEHATVVRRCLFYFCSGVFEKGPIHFETDSSSSEAGALSSDVESDSPLERGDPEGSNVLIGDSDVDDVATGQHNNEFQPPPFLEYPISHWMSHGREADSTICDIFDVFQDFFAPESPIRDCWLRSYHNLVFSTIPYYLDNFTLLHFAAYIGIQSLVKKIWDWIAVSRTSFPDFHIDTKDQRNYTALMHAALNGYGKVVELLLERGADAEATDEQGNTALILSAESGNTAAPLVLLDYGASAYAQNYFHETALEVACIDGQESVVKLLLQHTAVTGKSNDLLDIALRAAARFGYMNIVQLLLDEGARADQVESKGLTPLLEAAVHSHTSVVELLLKHNADVDSADTTGCSPLSLAATRGHKDTCDMLLKYGASLKMFNRVADDAISAVCCAGLKYNVRFLQEFLELWGTQKSELKDLVQHLTLAARQGYDASIKVLLEHKVTVNTMIKEEDMAGFYANIESETIYYYYPEEALRKGFEERLDGQRKALLMILQHRKEKLKDEKIEECDETKPVNSGI